MPNRKSKPNSLDPDVMKIFTGTEVGLLVESVNSNLETLAEGQRTIQQKLDRLVANQDAQSTRLDRVDLRLDVIEGRRP